MGTPSEPTSPSGGRHTQFKASGVWEVAAGPPLTQSLLVQASKKLQNDTSNHLGLYTIHTCVCIYIHNMSRYISIQTNIHTYMHTYIKKNISTYVCIYLRTHTSTQGRLNVETEARRHKSGLRSLLFGTQSPNPLSRLCRNLGLLRLMIELLHDFRYQNPRNYGSIVYMVSRRIYIINTTRDLKTFSNVCCL